MVLYIIRHGDPIYETDTLTERGRLQAEALGKRMAALGIDKVYSSPMGRARETAAPTCSLLGLEPVIEEWAHEIEDERLTPYPDGVMKSITMLPNNIFRENGNLYLSYDEAFQCTGIGESHIKDAVEFIERNGRDFLERLGYKEENGVYRIVRPSEERVALFCHSAFTKAWLSSMMHVPINIVWSALEVTHTGVTAIEFKNRDSGFTAPKILCISDVSHLYAEKLDTRHNNTNVEI